MHWATSWRNFHSWTWSYSADLAAFYLAAHFHHSDLFSIHLHRQPDYHPLRSAHNNNSLSGVITMDHASSRGHREQPGWYTLLSYRNTFPSLLNPLEEFCLYSLPIKFPGLFSWTCLGSCPCGWQSTASDLHTTWHVSLPAILTFLIYCILFDNLNRSLRVFFQQMDGLNDWLLPLCKYSSTIYCHCDSPRHLTNTGNECSWQEKRLVVLIFSTFSSFHEC